MSAPPTSSVREAVEFALDFLDDPTQFLRRQLAEHPYHIVIEIAFLIAFVYFYMIPLHKAKKLRVEPLTKKEEEMLLEEFRSEPFRSTRPDSNAVVGKSDAISQLHIVGRAGTTLKIQLGSSTKAVETLDLATFDFHSLSTHAQVREVAKHCVASYGVGSCGPRGFYGTVKPHLDLETDIAAFLGVDSCIIYSFSFATISTLIPCYASRGDYIVVDDGVSLPVQEGCHLSRAAVSYFTHNDIFKLEEHMARIQIGETKAKKLSRRFVVTEGLFRNSGDLCRLPEIISLCKKYRFRLILEDSYGFGALGPTGRGTPEHFQIPTALIDIYVGSMSNALGTVGGFCAGDAAMIDHQRLAATGYVFSASLPPYMTASASKALSIIDSTPSIPAHLQRNAKVFRNEVRLSKLPTHLSMVECADDVSPVVHIRATNEYIRDVGKGRVDEQFARVIHMLQNKRIIVLRHLYSVEERVENVPSLRVTLKGALSVAEVTAAARSVVASLRTEFGN